MAYHKRMEIMSNLLSKDGQNPINSLQLSYALNNGNVENSKLVSEATNNSLQRKTPYFVYEALVLNSTPLLWGKSVAKDSSNTISPQEVINIQLPYDVNQATERDFWNESFHPIFLYSTFENLPSDTKNIKESLCHITNYIKNKSIESNKANCYDIKTLEWIKKKNLV